MNLQDAEIAAIRRGKIPDNMTREEAGSYLTRLLFNAECATERSRPIHPARLLEIAARPKCAASEDNLHLSECMVCSGRLAELRLNQAFIPPPIEVTLGSGLGVLTQSLTMCQPFLNADQAAEPGSRQPATVTQMMFLLGNADWIKRVMMEFAQLKEPDQQMALWKRVQDKLLVADVAVAVVIPVPNETIRFMFMGSGSHDAASGTGVADDAGVSGQLECDAAGSYTLILNTDNPFYQGRILRVTGFVENSRSVLTVFLPIQSGEGRMHFLSDTDRLIEAGQPTTTTQPGITLHDFSLSRQPIHLMLSGEHPQDVSAADAMKAHKDYQWTQGNQKDAEMCWKLWEERITKHELSGNDGGKDNTPVLDPPITPPVKKPKVQSIRSRKWQADVYDAERSYGALAAVPDVPASLIMQDNTRRALSLISMLAVIALLLIAWKGGGVAADQDDARFTAAIIRRDVRPLPRLLPVQSARPHLRAGNADTHTILLEPDTSAWEGYASNMPQRHWPGKIPLLASRSASTSLRFDNSLRREALRMNEATAKPKHTGVRNGVSVLRTHSTPSAHAHSKTRETNISPQQ